MHLVDDARGGVWAAVRDSPLKGSPMRSPMRSPRRAIPLDPDDAYADEEPEWLDEIDPADLVEQDLVLEAYDFDGRESRQSRQSRPDT